MNSNRFLFISFFTCLVAFSSFTQAQEKVSYTVYFGFDKFKLTPLQKQEFDSLFKNKIFTSAALSGHTDNIGDQQYNLKLSYRRAHEVLNYLSKTGMDTSVCELFFFGESQPLNASTKNKSHNRRVEITAMVKPAELKDTAAIVSPITDVKTDSDIINAKLDNGIIIVCRKNVLPPDAEVYALNGDSALITLIETTWQMVENKIYTETTLGEMLSSAVVFCFNGNLINPCNLDSAVTIKIPLRRPVNCTLDKVKLFESADSNGVMLWDRAEIDFTVEQIDTVQYLVFKTTNLCFCKNFDFKYDKVCFPHTFASLQFKKLKAERITAILNDYNSVYRPARIGDEKYQLIITSQARNTAFFNFDLSGKRGKFYGLTGVPLSKLNYDKKKKIFILKKRDLKKLSAYKPGAF